jgi:ribonuclease D
MNRPDPLTPEERELARLLGRSTPSAPSARVDDAVLAAARAAVGAVADEHRLPVENLLSPDTVRRLAWDPPADADATGVAGFLRAHGAREWQVGLTAEVLAAALLGNARVALLAPGLLR